MTCDQIETPKKEGKQMSEVHTIEFQNPVFRFGRDGKTEINVTVRNGEKWKDKLKIGDKLEFGDTGDDNNPYRTARVCGVLCEFLEDIPAHIHKLNHDPSCRTKAGIKKELDRIYGEPGVMGRKVTVIFFSIS